MNTSLLATPGEYLRPPPRKSGDLSGSQNLPDLTTCARGKAGSGLGLSAGPGIYRRTGNAIVMRLLNHNVHTYCSYTSTII